MHDDHNHQKPNRHHCPLIFWSPSQIFLFYCCVVASIETGIILKKLMAKDPAVLFYTSDFLSGTAFFTFEERGKYITLLCEQHQNGNIPEHHFLKICDPASPVGKKFKKNNDGNYYNERMKEEKERRQKYSESRSKNGRSFILKKDKPLINTKIDIEHMHKHMGGHMETETDTDIKDVYLEKKEVKEKEKPLWYTSFQEYEKEAGEAFDRIVSDTAWLQERKKYHPALDIYLSLEKAFNDFWGQEAGWQHKKKSKSDKINWDLTFKNALTLKGNQVYEKRT